MLASVLSRSGEVAMLNGGGRREKGAAGTGGCASWVEAPGRQPEPSDLAFAAFLPLMLQLSLVWNTSRW